jgi:putative membrane protein
MMFWTDHDLSGWGWVVMTTSMVLFWGLLIAGGVLLFRALNQPAGGAPAGSRPSPEHLLAERFARGEIDEEEYQRRLATLTSARERSQAP